jgi:hypothetical protein
VVLMLAGPVVRSGWAGLFGRKVTHHLVLLDDSYSMTDHWDETSAFDQAKQAILRILERARGQADKQVVTLLRFSEARRLAAGAGPEIDRRSLAADCAAELGPVLTGLQPPESDAGPIEALQAAIRLPEATADETLIAYLITDFRRRQWQEQAQLQQLMGQLRQRTARLLLVGSAYDQRPNLAITRLEPEAGLRAAGVETWMELSVANYGDVPAAAATVAVEQDGSRLPAVEIDEIPPGATATRRLRVTFAGAGPHQVSARLESDAVDADNVRYFAADIPATLPILLVDGSQACDDGKYLRAALDPGGRKAAGWSPQVEPVSYLRRHEALPSFAAICLLDVPRLDDAEVAALEEYVRQGGGLAIFLGSEAQRSFYNGRLYHEGQGLLPAPLAVPSQLLRESNDAEPDIRITDHPVFRVFGGQRNSFLSIATVSFYYGLDAGWTPPASGDVRTIARLRNGAPLTIEKKLGAGRVVVHLAKLSPQPTDVGVWGNLSVKPACPVFANEVVGYLSAARRRYESAAAEEPIRLTLSEAEYQPEIRVRPPGAPGGDLAVVVPAAKDGQYQVEAPGKPKSGVWEFQLTTRDGKSQTRLVAVNVPRGEGDLHLVPRDELDERLPGVDFQFALASEFTEAQDALAGFRLSDALLYLAAGVLIVEQLLAVSAS